MVSMATTGERTLHIASRSGNIEVVRLLLQRAHADPNATDKTGRTPLFATCHSHHPRVDVVTLLLDNGADPALAEQYGLIPLHAAARNGHGDLVELLYSRAPATLNRCATGGGTPLYLACISGHESIVSKLISLGAMERMHPYVRDFCPLGIAVAMRFLGVVRVLISEAGMRAVGGEEALPDALRSAVQNRQTVVLRLLLTVCGEGRRSEWANVCVTGRSLIHFAAGFCYSAAVSTLLKAGADEVARDPEGHTAPDVVGLYRSGIDANHLEPICIDPREEVSIRRMLDRGPAYRARSWVWPSNVKADTNADGSERCNTASAAVVSSNPEMDVKPTIGVRIFRPKDKRCSAFFVRLIGRYCDKGYSDYR